LTAIGLSIPLEKRARRVVEEHEKETLQEDGERRCWQLIDWVNQLRRKTYKFAYLEDGGEQFDQFCAQLNRDAADQNPNVQRAQLTGWDEYILAVYSYDADKKATERYVAPGVKSLPVGSVRLPEHLAAARIYKSYVKISPILPVQVPAGFVPGIAPRAGEDAAPGMLVPCIWAAANYKRKSARFDKSLGKPPTGDETAQGGIAICISLYRGDSARHWQFLTDEQQYLLHPELGANGQPVSLYHRRTGTENKDAPVDLVADSRDRTQWDTGSFLPAPPSVPAAKNASNESPEDNNNALLVSQTERRRGPPETAQLAENFVFFEGRLPQESVVALNARPDQKEWLAGTVAESERNGYETTIEENGLVRIRARGGAGATNSRQALEKPKAAIEKALLERLKSEYQPIVWSSSPVPLKTADYQRIRFSLVAKPIVTGAEREDQESEIGPWYFLTSGVFHEELASGIAAELAKSRKWGTLVALVAALLALWAATYFVRPILAIADTARRVVADDSEEPSDGKLIERVESVAQEVELHTKRTDEVGKIARGLKKLLERVLEGHQELLVERGRLDRVVEEQTRDLKAQAEKLVKADKVKNNFISAMSHDLRSPLASIQGRIHLLMQTELNPKQRSGLEKVNLASLHLKNVIESILDFRRLEEGAIVLRPGKFDSAAFFRGLKEGILPLAQARNNQLEFEGTDDVGEMFTDETALRRALENLLNNACKFTAGGVVKLTVSPQQQKGRTWLMMAVSDTGRGIDPAVRPHLFTPFSKLADEQINPGGAGLGLANSRQYLQMMGGTLELGPESKTGTTFIIQIPADVRPTGEQGVAAASGEEHLQTEGEGPALSGEGRQLVLVVDDDPAVATSLEKFLIPRGYQVLSALDGSSGLALAKSRHPDVILLDVLLPHGQNGLDVLSELKKDPEVKDIPVMMLSFLEKTKLSEQKGAADYITKPIPWKDLLASLRRATGSSPTESAPVLVVDDDEKLRDVFKEVLTNNGFAVVEAANGAEALQRLREIQPSIILLDLRMPVVDGPAFLAELHRHAEWADIPVLVVTAAALTPEEERKISGSVAGIKNKSEEIHNAIVPAVLSTLNEAGLKPKTKEIHG